MLPSHIPNHSHAPFIHTEKRPAPSQHHTTKSHLLAFKKKMKNNAHTHTRQEMNDTTYHVPLSPSQFTHRTAIQEEDPSMSQCVAYALFFTKPIAQNKKEMNGVEHSTQISQAPPAGCTKTSSSTARKPENSARINIHSPPPTQ